MKAKLGKIWTDSVAYVMLLVGAGLSILFNVVNTLARRGDLIDWVDWVIAVAAPGLVVGMVEMFVNARWTGQRWYMQTLRWAGTLAIGGVAMRVSWTHGHELLLSRGQSGDVATLFPLSIDLLAIMATALILSGRAVAVIVVKPVDTATRLSADLEDKDRSTLDTWRAEVTQDIRPVDKDVDATPEDTMVIGGVDTEDVLPEVDLASYMGPGAVRWTPPADVPLLDVDIPNALPSWLDGLQDRTGPVNNVQAAPLPVAPPLPQRNANRRLSDAERADIAGLAAVGRGTGLYTVLEIRTLLAAWYGVSVKTIQRAEVGS